MSSNRDSGSGVTFGGIVKGFIKLMFWLIVIAGIAVAGYFGYQELTRSFDNVQERIDGHEQRIELLRDETTGLMNEAPTMEAELSGAMAEQAVIAQEVADMSEAESAFAADLAVQRALLEALQGQVDVLIVQTSALSGSVALLDEGILLIQEDLNQNWATTDQIGGSIDALAGEVDALALEDARLEAAIIDPGAELARMRQVLLIFQVWELASRARLHLIADNAGMAAEDITRAVRLLDGLEQQEETLLDREATASLRQRLELALAGLPDDPQAAASDLELAWDRLDSLLTLLLGLDVNAVTPVASATAAAETPEAPAPTATSESAPLPTTTPGPSETPEATPETTATPEVTTTPESSATPEVTATPQPTATP